MKILHTSDWHIGNYPGPEKNGINLRGQDVLNCLEYLVETAERRNPDAIVVSGDIFHQAKVWSDRGLEETRQAINIIERLGRIAPTVVLRGTPNHDGSEQFEMMKAHFHKNNSVSIVTEPKIINVATDVEPFKISKLQIACLPGFDRGEFRAKFPGLSTTEENVVFTEELGKIIMGLRAKCDNSTKVFISHYTVPGSNLESGQVQFLSQFEPVITPEILDSVGFDLVALGHIHRPQQVESCQNTFYSGAINALNFNDEGQERGFWIHDLLEGTHEFIRTPSREFATFKLTDTDITAINNNDMDAVAFNWWGHNDGARDKIVRILYNCTDENNKALNKALVEKRLYDDGAFWVQEITPEKITITANRNNLSEENTPENNLKEYLVEKAVPDEKIKELLEVARPIIAEATANNIIGSLTGLFVPVEIEVKNYRNYKEEYFNFRDISFCTINGPNGVGKSSLFMDAILDCLYEEPREGDLTGWINNDEKARSGSIKFTFTIGDKTFRVTRTRTKSGRATLNISELINEEWINRSRERMNDTQAEIINIIGMDSLTLRSCALIMQDQYGIFLQADKESRMNILGNILGLGIYGDMERLSKNRATEINREIRQHNHEVDKLSSNLPDEKELEKKIIDTENLVTESNEKIKEHTLTADNIKLKLNTKLEATTRALRLKEGINTLNQKRNTVEENAKAQREILVDAMSTLSGEDEIKVGVDKYNHLILEEKELLADKGMYDIKIAEEGRLKNEINKTDKEIQKLIMASFDFEEKKKPFEELIAQETTLKQKHDLYKTEREFLEMLEGNADEYITLSNSITELEKNRTKHETSYVKSRTEKESGYKTLKEKASLLEDSGCIDKENAECKFLIDAQNAKNLLVGYQDRLQTWKEAEEEKIKDIENQINKLIERRDSLNYDPEIIRNKRIILSDLEIKSKQYETLSAYKEQLKLIEERIKSIKSNSKDLITNLNQKRKELEEVRKELEKLKTNADRYKTIIVEINQYKIFVEKEKALPVAKEKKSVAEKRIKELQDELLDIDSEILAKQNELEAENKIAIGSEELKIELKTVESLISEKQSNIQSLAMKIGAYKKQMEDMEKDLIEISGLKKKVVALGEKVSRYEELKIAFSQDGVPHNIIRSILPMLEATANSILGQMSGGKMSMEFVTEKVLKSNSKKEVVTLDIIINEVGIGRLPYLSKSGGERVKSALSAILSLAEIKSSRAGIQLGMLFIDEPPFLDATGIQAYCDALETIQNRYKGLKIMAITHDPTMKARFPQSIDIEKTLDGDSRVILD